MFDWLNSAHAADIDSLCMRVCGDFEGRSKRWLSCNMAAELNQLAELFSFNFLSQLRQILIQNKGPGNARRRVNVQIGWIDKIPVARWSGHKSATEIGDSILLAFDEVVDPKTRKLVSARGRAVLLQAKVAKIPSQQLRPEIPITTLAGSTARELDLLSTWPTFDLYPTGKSDRSRPLATSISLPVASGPGTIPPYGWYIAAPMKKALTPAEAPAWPSWWMAGPAVSGAPCTVGFGELIVSFLTGGNAAPPCMTGVGHDFTWNGRVFDGLTSSAPDYWSKLCHHVIDLVSQGQYSFPCSIFRRMPSLRRRGSRLASVDPIFYMYDTEFYFERDSVVEQAYEGESCWSLFVNSEFQRDEVRKDHHRRKLKPVIVVSSTRSAEDEHIG